MRDTSVLVVEDDADERRKIGSWLDREGYEVLFCSGPQEPEFSCLGGNGSDCPLAKGADVVVLNLHLASDEMMMGTAAWQLLLYYYESGKKIVALSGSQDAVHPYPDDVVAVIRRPVERDSLLRALRQLVGHPAGDEVDLVDDPAR